MDVQRINKSNKIKFIYVSFFIFLNPIIFCNEITMKFKGKGEEDFFINRIEGRDCPDRIIIDDTLIPYKTCKYLFPNTIATIKLKFDNNINNFFRMFSDLINIIEIDFSKYNTSLVNNMSYMFDNCTSLISANLSNLDLSSIKSMDYMFRNCVSLKTLDFTNVDILQYNNDMNLFVNCANLKYNNLLNVYANNFKYNKYKRNLEYSTDIPTEIIGICDIFTFVYNNRHCNFDLEASNINIVNNYKMKILEII